MINDRNNTIYQQKCNRYFAQPERIVLTSHNFGSLFSNFVQPPTLTYLSLPTLTPTALSAVRFLWLNW